MGQQTCPVYVTLGKIPQECIINPAERLVTQGHKPSPSISHSADKTHLSLNPIVYYRHLPDVVNPYHMHVNSFSVLDPFHPFLSSYPSSLSFLLFQLPFLLHLIFSKLPFIASYDSTHSFHPLPNSAFLAPFLPFLSKVTL